MESPVLSESDNEVSLEESAATVLIAPTAPMYVPTPLSAVPAKPLEMPKMGADELRLTMLTKFMKARAARLKPPSKTKDGLTSKPRATSQFGYDEKGVFTEFDKNGAVVKKIPIPVYRRPTKDEVVQVEETRYNAIGAAEALYEEKIEELLGVIQSYKAGLIDANAVVYANQEAQEADYAISRAKYGATLAPGSVEIIKDGISLKRMDPSIKYGDKKADYPIYRLHTYHHSSQEMYVRTGEVPDADEEEAIAVAEAAASGDLLPIAPAVASIGVPASTPASIGPTAAANRVVLFNKLDDGANNFLSTEWPVRFKYMRDGAEQITYYTIEQGLAAEKARFFGDSKKYAEVMKTSSVRLIKAAAQTIGILAPTGGVGGDETLMQQRRAEWPAMELKLMKELTRAKFTEHKDLAAKLLGSGDALLVKADARDKIYGIGFAMTDMRAADPSKWGGRAGQNEYGKILMALRTELRETGAGPVGAIEPISEEAAISPAERASLNEEQRTGAIIGQTLRVKRSSLRPGV